MYLPAADSRQLSSTTKNETLNRPSGRFNKCYASAPVSVNLDLRASLRQSQLMAIKWLANRLESVKIRGRLRRAVDARCRRFRWEVKRLSRRESSPMPPQSARGQHRQCHGSFAKRPGLGRLRVGGPWRERRNTAGKNKYVAPKISGAGALPQFGRRGTRQPIFVRAGVRGCSEGRIGFPKQVPGNLSSDSSVRYFLQRIKRTQVCRGIPATFPRVPRTSTEPRVNQEWV